MINFPYAHLSLLMNFFGCDFKSFLNFALVYESDYTVSHLKDKA